MKILFISQRVPYPPNKGDKLRSFNEIVYLSKFHEIDLFCFADDKKDLQYKEELEKYCKNVTIVEGSSIKSNLRTLLALITFKPLSPAYFYSSTLNRKVKSAISKNNYNVLFAYCSSMAPYIDKYNNIKKVIDFVDVDSEKWYQYTKFSSFPKNIIYSIESRRLRKYEKTIAKNYDHSFLVSDKEVEDFKILVYKTEKITPLLNGVDTEKFARSKREFNSNNIVFTGAMDYFANIESVLYFVNSIFPIILKEIPEAHFYIVGSKPDKSLLDLASQNTNITATGFVDSVLPYMHDAAVFAAPMQIARGVQNKILEAMSAGTPVVTNQRGFEGITAEPGNDLIVEDDPIVFAEECIRIMKDKKYRNTLVQSGLKCIENNYSWNINLEKLNSIISKEI